MRLLPLSVALLLTAVAIPKYRPQAAPRTVVRWGLIALLAGVVSLIAALEVGVGPEIVAVPMLLTGLGVGALGVTAGSGDCVGCPRQGDGAKSAVSRTP